MATQDMANLEKSLLPLRNDSIFPSEVYSNRLNGSPMLSDQVSLPPQAGIEGPFSPISPSQPTLGSAAIKRIPQKLTPVNPSMIDLPFTQVILPEYQLMETQHIPVPEIDAMPEATEDKASDPELPVGWTEMELAALKAIRKRILVVLGQKSGDLDSALLYTFLSGDGAHFIVQWVRDNIDPDPDIMVEDFEIRL